MGNTRYNLKSQSTLKKNEKATTMIVKLFNLLKKIIRKLTSYIYFKQEQLILQATLKPATSKLATIGYHGSDNDQEFIHQVKKHFPHKYKLFKKRLEQNIHCYRTYSDQNILVAYGWATAGEYYEPTLRYTFHPKLNQIYQFDGFVQPAHRKGTLANLTMRMLWNPFAEKGFTSTLAIVDKSNIHSLKWHAFIRFKETGEKIVTYYIFRIPFSVLEPYSERYMKVRELKKPADA